MPQTERCREIAINKVTNLTEGSCVRGLVELALPIFVGSLIQQLYNTVDLMFVAKLLGKEAAASVGSCGMLIACILGFFTGLSVGVAIVAGNAFGAGNFHRLKRLVHTGAGLTLSMGGVMLVISIIMAPTFLKWMNVPESILPMSTEYLRVYLLSLFSIIGYNIGAGFLRALGNSRTPMLYQLYGGIANVAGNTLFIYVLDLGIFGAASATFLSQSVAAFLTIREICRLDERYRLRFREICLDRRICHDILKIGIPSAVQSMVISFSNTLVQSEINLLGVDTIAAFSGYFKEENFVYLPIISFGQANMSFFAQNSGAGLTDRAKRGTKLSIIIGVIITVAISTALTLGHKHVFALFTDDPAVMAIGWQVVKMTIPFYFLYVFLEVLSSAIRGAGHAFPPMVIVLLNSCLLRLILLKAVMYIMPTASAVASVYPLTWATNTICFVIYYKYGHWDRPARRLNAF